MLNLPTFFPYFSYSHKFIYKFRTNIFYQKLNLKNIIFIPNSLTFHPKQRFETRQDFFLFLYIIR